VQRQRWVDRDAQPELHARILIDGPLSGRCPRCDEPALGRVTWVEVKPSDEVATLVMQAHQRAELIDALREHLDAVAARGGPVPGWMLRPVWRFESTAIQEAGAEDLSRPAEPEDAPTDPRIRLPKRSARVAPRPRMPSPAIPQPVAGALRSRPIAAPGNDAYVTELAVSAGVCTVHLILREDALSHWGRAALRCMPVHLRGHGYPLVGMRMNASYLGATSVIDAVVDVAEERSNEVFTALSTEVRVRLVLQTEEGSPIHRDVTADGLERNAALVLESARAVLASEDFLPDAYEAAVEHLAATPRDRRLVTAEHSLSVGDFRHLVSPRETLAAVEALDRTSDKGNLSHVLEVDGLPIGEFEDIRRRVLAASVEMGLCAPRRFWRRIIASGLANDPQDYAERLAAARSSIAASGRDDLDPEQVKAAWKALHDLCARRDLALPSALVTALGLEPEQEPKTRPPATRSASGFIDVAPAEPSKSRRVSLEPQLTLRSDAGPLGRAGERKRLPEVFASIETLDEGALLSLVPPLSELGAQAVPGLLENLESQRRQVRQIVAILLAQSPDSSAVGPLCRRLFEEETKAWIDIARAIGAHGPRVLGRLAAELQNAAAGPGPDAVVRGARAMAEIAARDHLALDAVEALQDATERDVAAAALRASGILEDVRMARLRVRGEQPFREVTVVRGFSRRVFDALLSTGDLLSEDDIELVE
jgi:hypothetical protein